MTAFDELMRGDGASAAAARETHRATSRAFRPRRLWPALVVSAVFAALGCLVAIDVISMLAGHQLHVLPDARLIRWAGGTAWHDLPVRIIGGALVVVGMLLVGSAVLPGRTRLITLAGDDPTLVVGLTRGGLARAVRSAVTDVDGVDGAKVTVRRRRARVVARTPLREPKRLATEVRDAAVTRIEAFVPARPMKVTVRVRRAR